MTYSAEAMHISCKAVKKDELFKEIPVVIISTEANQTKIDEFMACGAAGYITKPFTPESIRDIIIDLLGEVNYEESFDDGDDEFDF